MKNRKSEEYNGNGENVSSSISNSINKKKKKRLGGGGLSLEAFANAKSKSIDYNPALIKKQREFYNNAKYVKRYKKLMKQQNGTDNQLSAATNLLEGHNETGDGIKTIKKQKNKSQGLEELYKKKHEEEEKARMEREAIIQAKKEERERVQARRKTLREKMFKKTRSGQPVMKYRIEYLLESIQASNS
ncbi:PREDICTED: rRNA-processing protein FYV7 [Nelumbo nucifera]|uniref:rRNA-processing protein FYV7 n=1 Tax=Nelumbo nucifera TaxID=4432 RepID=A0A1U7Z7M2_NELNU|nr:PREDICTED: rRNA-processing protein FYV7 [Nelumbo nucifera]